LEPAALEAVLTDPNLLIVDVCQPATWQQLHIPGAVHINPNELVCGIPPASGKMPSLAQLDAVLSRIGYSADKHVVAYDDEGGGWAGRLLWQLEVIGHTRYSLLDGGLHSWSKEGHPVTNEIKPVTPTAVKTAIRNPAVIAELDTVLDSLNDPHVKVWDARSRDEYLGLRSGSQRAGHVPGAFNIDWLDAMDRSRNLRLLPLPQLKAKLDALGVKDSDTIITHCQSHHRSGLTWVIAKLLGHKALGYHGSWGEWGNNHDVPVEKIA
ncbi:MAG TPA: rhodanese-like domain-containing protein, partial [Candidatus Acidoferrum sp.]|nr:rhodanese-like domain-containing protein [Candidatus Acidoferrum sp.]